MKSKMIAMTLVLLLAVLGSGTACAQRLVIWQKDNIKVSYDLDEQPKTTFTQEELVITTKTTTITYPLSKIQRYTYEGGALSIHDVETQAVSISHRGNDIVVTGLPNGKTVTVYSVDGKLLLSKRSDASERLTLSLNTLLNGVYVIKADEVTYKFLKQ